MVDTQIKIIIESEHINKNKQSKFSMMQIFKVDKMSYLFAIILYKPNENCKIKYTSTRIWMEKTINQQNWIEFRN